MARIPTFVLLALDGQDAREYLERNPDVRAERELCVIVMAHANREVYEVDVRDFRVTSLAHRHRDFDNAVAVLQRRRDERYIVGGWRVGGTVVDGAVGSITLAVLGAPTDGPFGPLGVATVAAMAGDRRRRRDAYSLGLR